MTRSPPEQVTELKEIGLDGTSITCRADSRFSGLANLAEPFLQSRLERLGDGTEQLAEIINAL